MYPILCGWRVKPVYSGRACTGTLKSSIRRTWNVFLGLAWRRWYLRSVFKFKTMYRGYDDRKIFFFLDQFQILSAGHALHTTRRALSMRTTFRYWFGDDAHDKAWPSNTTLPLKSYNVSMINISYHRRGWEELQVQLQHNVEFVLGRYERRTSTIKSIDIERIRTYNIYIYIFIWYTYLIVGYKPIVQKFRLRN